MDISEALERDIPDGPPLPDPRARAATGRSALRRRRALVGTAALAVAAVVAVPLAVAAGGQSGRGVDPAPPASAPQTPEPQPRDLAQEPRTGAPDDAPNATRPDAAELAAAWPWSRGQVAFVDPVEHVLLLRPGAEVLERRDDLFPGKDTESVAMRVRFRGEEYWVQLEWDRGGSGGTFARPGDPFYADFDDFVAKSTSGGGMTSQPPPRKTPAPQDDWPEPVEIEGLRWADGRLAVDGPARILEQRGDIDLGPAFAAPGETTGAALVETPDGTRVLVVYREQPGAEGQLIAVTADGEGDILADQLAWARQRYRSGAGLL